MEFNKKLTDDARASLIHAEMFSDMANAKQVGTEHILLGMMNQVTSVACRILGDAGVTFGDLASLMNLAPATIVRAGSQSKGFSDALKMTLRVAAEVATQYHQECCGTEHILFSLMTQTNSKAYQLLTKLGVDTMEIMAELNDYLEGTNRSEAGANDGERLGNTRSQRKANFLAKYSRDLTKIAKDGKLDPVIGRNREIDRMITILSRRTKNNPVLIGEAGVGKTAVVEGLAERIASGEVPSFIANKKIIQLDLAALLAGTKFRGEFEDRLKRVVGEVQKDKNLIVFIDELHLLIGAGAGNDGAMDAANILKPALSRGDFRLIGATTSDEYRKFIEKDSALTRRFQEIMVDEPNETDTIKILKGLAPKYEEYHHVKINENIIKEAVRLSQRYLPERKQPDKALDVIDETSARVHIANATSKVSQDLAKFRTESKKLNSEMEAAVNDEDYEKAALLKMRISRLNEQIKKLEKDEHTGAASTIKLNDVARTVSVMTGVPLEQLQRDEAVKLANLEKRIGRRIIGQKQAVSAVADAIRRSRAGISDSRRPIGSFIFLGPTGVGKTELAKVLADEVFGSRKSLIKVDMSEFSERHTVARLVGAPAGYVGYDDGGTLTDKVRRQPYSVILFDEIEKAHPDVFNILLQILEDGTLTDGHNKTVDFRNCVIILTSNIGANEMVAKHVGFVVGDAQDSGARVQDREEVMNLLQQKMRPELLNRFDEIIMFNALTRAEVNQIFDIMIDDLNRRLAVKGVGLVVSGQVKRYLVDKGFSPKYGARPLRRVVQQSLEHLLAEQIIRGDIKRGDMVRATIKNGEIVLQVETEKTAVVAKTKKMISSN